MIKISQYISILAFTLSCPAYGYDKVAYKQLVKYSKREGCAQELVLEYKDFSGANLNKLNLDGITLKLCNLDRAKLVTTSFVNANLVGCSFKNALFHFTDFRGADLRFADFRCKINMRKRYLGLYLRYAAYFEGSDLSSANFLLTPVDGISFDDTTTMLGTMFCQRSLEDYDYLPKALWKRPEIIMTPNQYRYYMRQRD